MSQPKLVVFDLDDTLITSNTWLKFNTALGVSKTDDDQLYIRYHQGELTYEEWLHELTSLYKLEEKHFTKDHVTEVLSVFDLAEGAVSAVEYLRQLSIPSAILTGSFKTTADAVAKTLGINHTIANTTCTFDTSDRLIAVESHGDEAEQKPVHLKKLLAEKNLKPSEVLVVGGGANDIPLFTYTGTGVTFSYAKPAVQQAAKWSIDSLEDLSKIITRLI